MATLLTFEHIESTIQSLPLQYRTMLRLLLLQYFDVQQDEIDYMATDQPDSRFLAGVQPKGRTLTLEAVQNITSRANQYKTFYRQKRERPGMHVLFLEQSLAILERSLRIARRLLQKDMEATEEELQEARTQAPVTLIRQEIRHLSRAWESQEIPAKEFQRKRLLLEFQSLLRKQILLRRRLKFSKQEFITVGSLPLKDHEIAHIWGIPLGSLAARKVKALQQFLQGLQAKIETAPPDNDSTPPTDYWRETFQVLANRPFERSIVQYDGLERTEEKLMEKLGLFLSGSMTEQEESKFWTSISKVNDSEFSGSWQSHARSILAFQRLNALLQDMDISDEALEEDILARVTPKAPDDQLATPDDEDKPVELGEMGLGVLNAFAGEIDDKRSF
ncbi:MAG: hypothetical protein R3B83_04480 [Nitrospirales bacterium]|nr:hypothetical protein [Nitrospira sp.]MCB9711225.1 hypothetical protein [Nitrospiraceae bacterium]MDR4486768.1 hypothetical protein [Nitrospirales bacterium]